MILSSCILIIWKERISRLQTTKDGKVLITYSWCGQKLRNLLSDNNSDMRSPVLALRNLELGTRCLGLNATMKVLLLRCL